MFTGVLGGCPGHDGGKDAPLSPIDEIVREGTRLLAEALRAEVHAYIARFAGQRRDDGRRLVVRNGYHRSREVLTGAGGHWAHLVPLARAGARSGRGVLTGRPQPAAA